MPFVHKWKYEALMRVGGQMSNVMFNLKQDNGQSEKNKATMAELQTEWHELVSTVGKEQA